MKLNFKEIRKMQIELENKVYSKSGFKSIEDSGIYEVKLMTVERKVSKNGNIYDVLSFATNKGNVIEDLIFYGEKAVTYSINKIEDAINRKITDKEYENFELVKILTDKFKIEISVTEKTNTSNKEKYINVEVKKYLPLIDAKKEETK